MASKSVISRRSLVSMALGATLLPRSARGSNDQIRVGVIGAGNRGKTLATLARKIQGVEVAAVSDTLTPFREDLSEQLGGACKPVHHYQEILDDKQIDAVIITTPDHWHAKMILEAISAGKDLYCEKPIVHQLDQADELLARVEASGRILATGTQQRSWDHYIKARKLVKSGALGNVRLAEAYWYSGLRTGLRENAVLAYLRMQHLVGRLDWNEWLGPAPERDFDAFTFRNWRYFWDFGGGILTDLFTHLIDVIHWFLGVAQPIEIQASGATQVTEGLETPDTVSASLIYPGKISVFFHSSMVGYLRGGAILFRGDQAMMKVTREGFAIYAEPQERSSTTELPAPEVSVRATSDGTKSNLENWIHCMRTRDTPRANLRAGIDAAKASCWANQALRQRQTLKITS